MLLASRRSVEARQKGNERAYTHTISLKFPSGIYGPPSCSPMLQFGLAAPMPFEDEMATAAAAAAAGQTGHKSHETGVKTTRAKRQKETSS